MKSLIITKCFAVCLMLAGSLFVAHAQNMDNDIEQKMSVFITTYDSFGIRHIERIIKEDEAASALDVAQLIKENIDRGEVLVHGYIKKTNASTVTNFYFDDPLMKNPRRTHPECHFH